MEESILDAVSGYLFEDQSGKDLFKSLYNAKVYGQYQGKALELLEKSVEIVPKYAYQNTAFSYAMTNTLLPKFQLLIAESEQSEGSQIKSKKPKVDKQSTQESANSALQNALQQLGIQEDGLSGQKTQDELLGEIEGQGEDLVRGILASDHPNIQDAARVIKRIDASLKSVEKSIKNISAISDSVLKGLEKVKSDCSDFGYSYGRNLAQIDPSELAYLQGDARQLFLLRYAKGELLEESSIDKKGLGDLIICVDTSGSTDSSTQNNCSVLGLEMGIALAISKIAAKHKCKIKILLFTTQVHYQSDWLQGKEKINAEFGKLYTNNEATPSGGTNFNSCLNLVCDDLEQRQYPSQRKPGIIFITDGEASVNSTIQDRLTELKVKQGINLFSYFINTSDPREHSTAKDLVDISKQSYWIDTRKKIENQLEAFIEVSR